MLPVQTPGPTITKDPPLAQGWPVKVNQQHPAFKQYAHSVRAGGAGTIAYGGVMEARARRVARTQH